MGTMTENSPKVGAFLAKY